MTMARQVLGKAGEDMAVAEVGRRGYALLARRYRTRYGEIDIVARDGDTVVFVEVKVRTTAERGTAAEAVTPAKQWRLVRMAEDYLARCGGSSGRCRFDVAAIDGEGPAQRLTWYRDAFRPG